MWKVNNKEKRNAVIALILILIVIFLALFFLRGCNDDKAVAVKKIHHKVKPKKVEKKVELPEFIKKKEFYPTGELKAVYYVYRVKPDIRHKTYTGYYKTGEKKLQYIYNNNVKDGILLFWYKNGKKAMEGAFKNDKREGKFKEYHPNGNLKLTYEYKDGLLEGIRTEYYDDGKTKMIEKPFKKGLIDGTLSYYQSDGTEKFHQYYKDGKIARPDNKHIH